MRRKKYKLGELIYDFSVKAKDFEGFNKLEFFGVSNDRGIIPAKYASKEKIEDYKIIEKGCFAYNPYRINVGSIAYVEKKVTGLISPAYVVFKANENLVIPYLLFRFLKSNEGLRQIIFWGRGTVREALRFNDLSKLEIELPEIEEQKRLYNKIQACESIEGKIDKEIHSQLSLLSSLRQAILTEAVQGQLTAQWRKENPNPEHARELLKRIAAEKAQLIKEKKISKENPLPAIKVEEVPYALPEGWVWCYMQDLCPNISSGSTPPSQHWKESGIPYLKVYNIRNQKIDFSYKEQFIDPQYHSTKSKRSILRPGDVIMNIVGPPLGKVAIIPSIYDEWNCNQAISFFKPILNSLNEWIYSFLCEGSFLKDIELIGTAGQDNISITKCKNIKLSIPPLPEQHAIIQKVNSLMAYCDELEQQVQQSKTDLELLMQSVLSEVFGTENQAISSKSNKTKQSEKGTLMPAEVVQTKYEGNTLNMELLEILQQQGGKIAAINLWKMSKYQKDIDAFYEALKKEVEQNKTIKESSEKGWLELVAS